VEKKRGLLSRVKTRTHIFRFLGVLGSGGGSTKGTTIRANGKQSSTKDVDNRPVRNTTVFPTKEVEQDLRDKQEKTSPIVSVKTDNTSTNGKAKIAVNALGNDRSKLWKNRLGG